MCVFHNGAGWVSSTADFKGVIFTGSCCCTTNGCSAHTCAHKQRCQSGMADTNPELLLIHSRHVPTESCQHELSIFLPEYCNRFLHPKPLFTYVSCSCQIHVSENLPYFVDLWTPICQGRNPSLPADLLSSTVSNVCSNAAAYGIPPVSGSSGGPSPAPVPQPQQHYGVSPLPPPSHLSRLCVPGSRGSTSGSGFWAGLPAGGILPWAMKPDAAVALAGFEWQLKQRAALAVEHFNKDYKKGFQFLQVGAPGISRPLAPSWEYDVCKSWQKSCLSTVLGSYLADMLCALRSSYLDMSSCPVNSVIK